ncbi:hypothetical protein GQ42DRAFT_160776 [Ramicandelaber brevisporus]|nr:hypothetical protein GQ42DRAFT_160776 [Ramicandelaber brevisporus]
MSKFTALFARQTRVTAAAAAAATAESRPARAEKAVKLADKTQTRYSTAVASTMSRL